MSTDLGKTELKNILFMLYPSLVVVYKYFAGGFLYIPYCFLIKFVGVFLNSRLKEV